MLKLIKTVVYLFVLAAAFVWLWLARDAVADKLAAVLPESAVTSLRSGLKAAEPTVDPIVRAAVGAVETVVPVGPWLPTSPGLGKPDHAQAAGATSASAAPAGGKPAADATTAKAGEPKPAAPPARRETPPVPVSVAEVAKKPMPVTIDLVGSVQAIASIPIRTRVDSLIDKLGVAEGDHVKQGDVLFELDARTIRAQLAQSEAALARDQAQIVQYRSDLERAQQLVKTNATTQKAVETAQTQVATQEAIIAADRAAVDNLRVQLTYYTIKSPIDGRVGSLPLKAGSAIRAADATLLATVNQLDPVYVSFSVPQASVPALREALRAGPVKVGIRSAGLGLGKSVEGVVSFTENTLDVSTGTLTTKATVPNPDERLLPGEFVQVRVTLSVEPEALVVPEAALQVGQAGQFVYALKPDQTVEVRQVKVARTIDGQSVISGGVAAGDKIVVEGQLRLFPGARTVPAQPSPGAAAPKPAPAG